MKNIIKYLKKYYIKIMLGIIIIAVIVIPISIYNYIYDKGAGEMFEYMSDESQFWKEKRELELEYFDFYFCINKCLNNNDIQCGKECIK